MSRYLFTMMKKKRVLALKHGLSEDDYIFDRQLFRNDTDLHHQRELRAKDLYQRICDDMQNNPCKRAEYQQMIKEIFKQHKKALRENLNTPYYSTWCK